jgi:hypothetical protein
MSTKSNKATGGKKARGGWSSAGGGMSKHGKSGHSHNHAITIMRVREENERIAKEAEIKRKRKGQMFSTVREAFNS